MGDKRRELLDLMAHISDRCWCAGWTNFLEFDLWQMQKGHAEGVFDRDRDYGIGEVSAEELQRLHDLSVETGGWWAWLRDDQEAPEFIPLEEWGKGVKDLDDG